MTLPDRPKNIGIKAFQIYIPGQAVSQAALEQHDGVSAGKYTIGLGQTNMAFVNDREDTYSLALTVTKALLDDYGIDPASIGRLEVGTETLLDKSKSVKSVLMQLFGENTDIEGLDSINACYGGTNALFNAINWVESSTWDGRNAIVVAVDIAIYAKGAARSTGGAGAVAFLVGPDASIVFDPIHGSHMEHVYDFYKPDFTSEYPVVDGHFSLTCYTRALDRAYEAYNGKAVRLGFDFAKDATLTGMDRFDYSVFHVPTCKLVSKCYARLHYIDYRQDASLYTVQDSIKNLDYEASLTDKSVEKTFLDLVKEKAKKRLGPGIFGPTNIGNMYTASLYSSLASLLSNVPTEELRGKRISLYSYGSGLAASFFSCVVKENVSVIAEKLQLKQKLAQREIVTPKAYEAAIALRERANLRKGYKPEGAIEHIPQGAYYLIEVDDKFRRFYAVKG